ncbi:MAG TPA: hypothetical protein VGC01_01585 [Mucilaginibacter sp.]
MKFRIVFAFVLMMYGINVQAKFLLVKFDKAAFYAIIKSGNKDEIDNELTLVTASSIPEKEGYEGFLLMRKAGLIGKPAEKLKLFKAGRIKLETAIAGDEENVEYHFLRLIIEEKAPKIVKYHNDLETDKEIIINAYKNLPAVVQQAIIDYSKTSKVLHATDF